MSKQVNVFKPEECPFQLKDYCCDPDGCSLDEDVDCFGYSKFPEDCPLKKYNNIIEVKGHFNG